MKSVKDTENYLKKISNNIEKATEDFIEKATERLYELVIDNCNKHNIDNPLGRIHKEYDKEKGIGKVYTDDYVIILNEFGTGIKGTQDSWANDFEWQVNKSGKGEKGWYYPTEMSDPNPHKFITEDGQVYALTHGLDSRHMFYDAWLQLQSEYKEIVSMTIGKAIGDLYE